MANGPPGGRLQRSCQAIAVHIEGLAQSGVKARSAAPQCFEGYHAAWDSERRMRRAAVIPDSAVHERLWHASHAGWRGTARHVLLSARTLGHAHGQRARAQVVHLSAYYKMDDKQ
jgi:hypothetical protein